MTEEEWEKKEQEGGKGRSRQRYFVCIELTHVTIVKSPRDTWLPFRGAALLCVIHVLVEESASNVGVSEQKKKESFFYCELWTLFVNPWADDQVQSRKKVFFTSSLNCQRFRSLVENVNTLKYHDTFDSRYLISILQHCILFLINN